MPTSRQNGRTPEKEFLAEQFYSQVSESIKLVFDLTSRVDERVKMLVERQNNQDDKIEKFLEIQNEMIRRIALMEGQNILGVRSDLTELSERIAAMSSYEKEIDEMKEEVNVLKNKVQLMELQNESISLRTQQHDNKWRLIGDFIWKMSFILLGGYLLYKFGWQSPPTP